MMRFWKALMAWWDKSDPYDGYDGYLSDYCPTCDGPCTDEGDWSDEEA